MKISSSALFFNQKNRASDDASAESKSGERCLSNANNAHAPPSSDLTQFRSIRSAGSDLLLSQQQSSGTDWASLIAAKEKEGSHTVISLRGSGDSADNPAQRLKEYQDLSRLLRSMMFNKSGGVARIHMRKNVPEIVNNMKSEHGSVRLVIGGQRPATHIDEGATPFVYHPYYEMGASRYKPNHFSINVDLAANPDLWGDPARPETMRRFEENSIDEVLFENVPFGVASTYGDVTTQDYRYRLECLERDIEEGEVWADIAIETKKKVLTRKGLDCWANVHRVMTEGGRLELSAAGGGNVLEIGEMVNKAKEVGLIVDQVYFSIDSPSKGIESIFVLVQGEKAEISVEKRGVLCNSKRVSYNDNWSWLGDNGYGKEGKGKIGAEAIISSVDIIAHKPTADE